MLRERKGEYATTPFPSPPSAPPREAAEGAHRSSDPAPASYNDGASIRSPLSRSAGAGPGVRATALLLHRSDCRLTEGIYRRINDSLRVPTG